MLDLLFIIFESQLQAKVNPFGVCLQHCDLIKGTFTLENMLMMADVTPLYSLKIFETSKHKDVSQSFIQSTDRKQSHVFSVIQNSVFTV